MSDSSTHSRKLRRPHVWRNDDVDENQSTLTIRSFISISILNVGAGHARDMRVAGTKNSCPGTRMARSYAEHKMAARL
jgi:hypothetical protein